MDRKTSIQISKSNQILLNRLKLSSDETYNDVLTRLIRNFDIPQTAYALYNGVFKVIFIVNIDNNICYFLDDLGNKSKTLEVNQRFVNKKIQKEYNCFINAIKKTFGTNQDLVNCGAKLEIGEIKSFERFILEKLY